MWVMIVQLFVYCSIFLLNYINPVNSHIPSYVSTPSNKIEQFCQMSDHCVHDTIPICGKMGDQKRTFLDLCDMLEFACDTNNIHHWDPPGPKPAEATGFDKVTISRLWYIKDFRRNMMCFIYVHIEDVDGCPAVPKKE